jgi:hypothetical protein
MKPFQKRTKGGTMDNGSEACRTVHTSHTDTRRQRVSRELLTGIDPFSALVFLFAAFTLLWHVGASAAPAPIQFGAASYSFDEDAGTVSIDVEKPAVAINATVEFQVSDGSAVAGTDFIVQTSSPLRWPETDTTAKTIAIQILPNAVVEAARSFQIELSNAVSDDGEAQLGSITTTTVTIRDDDPGTGAVATVVSGDGQSAVVGDTLDSLVLEITDGGQPVADALVTWSVSPPGAASLQTGSSQTGADGRTSNSLTLNNEDGIGQVTVTAVAEAEARVVAAHWPATLPQAASAGRKSRACSCLPSSAVGLR